MFIKNSATRQFLGIALLFITLSLSACYSFSTTSLPRHLRSITIHEVQNQTMDPSLGDLLRKGFQDLFKKEAPNLRQLNMNANSELFITLQNYSNRPLDYDRNGNVERYRVSMAVDVIFYDAIKKDTLYNGKNLRGEGDYDVTRNESEQLHGQKRALQQIQDLIVNNVLSDW